MIEDHYYSISINTAKYPFNSEPSVARATALFTLHRGLGHLLPLDLGGRLGGLIAKNNEGDRYVPQLELPSGVCSH